MRNRNTWHGTTIDASTLTDLSSDGYVREHVGWDCEGLPESELRELVVRAQSLLDPKWGDRPKNRLYVDAVLAAVDILGTDDSGFTTAPEKIAGLRSTAQRAEELVETLEAEQWAAEQAAASLGIRDF